MADWNCKESIVTYQMTCVKYIDGTWVVLGKLSYLREFRDYLEETFPAEPNKEQSKL